MNSASYPEHNADKNDLGVRGLGVLALSIPRTYSYRMNDPVLVIYKTFWDLAMYNRLPLQKTYTSYF